MAIRLNPNFFINQGRYKHPFIVNFTKNIEI